MLLVAFTLHESFTGRPSAGLCIAMEFNRRLPKAALLSFILEKISALISVPLIHDDF
jgi:hypothetical protein